MRVQLELKARGFYAGPVDGRLTDEVRNALRAFQIVQRLPESGTMDNATLAKLGITY
jgi:peptidoglycan hydrolase-like protein with peptidoglycan-binding domain